MRDMSEIRRNIRSVEETRQVTNAMFLLSTSRMKHAMQQIGHNREYMKRIRAAVHEILAHMPQDDHPFMRYSKEKDIRPSYLVIAADKGLCGAYNQNLLRLARDILEKQKSAETLHICTVGEQATHTLTAAGYQPDVAFTGAAQRPDTYYARAMAEHFVRMFRDGAISSFHIIYTHYKNQLTQTPRCLKLLPVEERDFAHAAALPVQREICFEPSAQEVFDRVIPQYLVGMIYDCLHHAACSEQISRMNAMQSATKNADEMLHRLQLQYNTVRQLAITNEITEIAAAASLADNAV